MATTLKFGSGQWATKEGSALAYNDENGNFKPLPFDFTRASNATRVNKEGLIETVGADQPRIDFLNDSNGALLLEPSRTNLITQSEAFDNAYWTKSGASVVSGFASPSADSPLGAYKLVEDTNNGLHQLKNIVTFTSSISSGSLFVKAAEVTKIRITEGASTGHYIEINLVSGELISSNGTPIYSVKQLANGWFKISLTPNLAIARYDMYVTLVNNALQTSYAGDGTSGVYIFGAQVEQGYATSYIPTQGTAQTKVADVCNNGGNDQVFNDSEGVLMMEIAALANDSYRLIGLSDGTNGNNVRINLTPTPNQIIFEANSGNSLQAAFTYNGVDVLLNNKIAIKYKQNDYSFWVNGIKVGTDTSGNTPIGLDRINFDRGTGGNVFYGKTKQIQYFNTALTDAELIALTQV